MTGSDSEKAKKYRERAKEIRVISEDVRDDDARKLLRTVARDYEDMADAFTSKPKAKGRK